MLIYTKKNKDMKNKIIAIMMTLLLVSGSTWSRELSKTLKDFKKIDGVTYIGMNEKILLYFLAKKCNKKICLKKKGTKDKPAKFIKRLSCIKVVCIESGQRTKTEELQKEVDETMEHGYNLLTKVKHEDGDVKIYIKSKNEKIRELFIIVEDTEEKDLVMVLLKGKFNMKDMDFDNAENLNFINF